MNYYDGNADLELMKEVQDRVIKRIAKDRIRDIIRIKREFNEKLSYLADEEGFISTEEDMSKLKKIEYEYMRTIFSILEGSITHLEYLVDNE